MEAAHTRRLPARIDNLLAGVDLASTQLLAVVVASRTRSVLALKRQEGAFKAVELYR